MAWLEAHQELRDHPKTKRAARTLGISRPQMIGHLLCLWWWCLDYAETGCLSDFDNDDIADAAAWEGDPDTFVSALLNCGPADRPGFLIDTGAGLTVNDWDEYGGKYVTKRTQGRERQRTYRQRNAVVTRDKSVSNTTREDKIREDETRGENATATDQDTFRSEMVRQYEEVVGMIPTASYPEMIGYMDKLQELKVPEWWGLALIETTGANRPGWQFMKAVLSSWLASGKPNTGKNGTDPAKKATTGTFRQPSPDGAQWIHFDIATGKEVKREPRSEEEAMF